MTDERGLGRLARVETFARAGHAARGAVYILLGYFALTTAERGGQGTTSVLREIKEMPLSTPLLILAGLGLLGWGFFRLYGAIVDIQGEGTDAKGIGTRVGHALSGFAHIALCYIAIRLALGSGSDGSSEQKKQAAASTAEQLPMGEMLIALVGVGFAIAAVQQLGKAATGKFVALLSPQAPSFVEGLGRAGYAARGVVFAGLAWQILEVAFGSGSSEQVGIGGALDALRGISWLYILVALGLILFGIFSLAMARYREIRDENVIDRLRGSRQAPSDRQMPR